MYRCACMYKDMYECMHVCNDVGKVCTYIDVHVCMYKDMYKRMHVCKDVGKVRTYVEVYVCM
ncbi:hypothetical protein HanHA300_Chr00c0099g0709661 [Helianthus annuus]|nr:hypothetical protein HanHA300_Chr00c0099g0709661 [Helianthus annuus]KAJ0699988.1 hypothetical protein HanOQP8_Chr10g0362441 [Helianthus annuus]KAJ0778209.1 hypothetical protein HanLR1_Chr02g0069181 [Helianthus annuus]